MTMSQAPGPLILSEKASRRLRLLHGMDDDDDEITSKMGSVSILRVGDLSAFEHCLDLGKDRSEEEGEEQGTSRDPLCAIGMAVETLLKLQLRAGVLVDIRRNDGSDLEGLWSCHMGHVVALELPDAAADTAYIHPILAHNMGLALDADRLLLGSDPPQIGGDAEPRHATVCLRRSEQAEIPIAKMVQLSPVAFPASDLATLYGDRAGEDGASAADIGRANDEADALIGQIQSHFLQVNRVLRQWDLVCVHRPAGDLARLTDALANGTKLRGGAPTVLMVASMLPPSTGPLRFVPGETDVMLEGTARSLVPPSLRDAPVPLQIGGPTTDFARLLAGITHPRAKGFPLRLAVLLHGPPGSGRRSSALAAAAAAGYHSITISAHALRAPDIPEDKSLEALRTAFASAAAFAPVVLIVREFEVLGSGEEGGAQALKAGTALTDCLRRHGRAPHPVVLAGIVERPDSVGAPLRRCFTHEMEVSVADAEGRAAAFSRLLFPVLGRDAGLEKKSTGVEQELPQGHREHSPGLHSSSSASNNAASFTEEDVRDAARHSAGLTQRELRAVVSMAAVSALPKGLISEQTVLRRQQRVENASSASHQSGTNQQDSEETSDGIVPLPITPTALQHAIERVRGMAAADVGAPKIPSVKWEDVGGLEDVKRAILDMVDLPLRHPELFAGGLRRRSGVLLYGPPGTGKTLLAKAVATECSINFLSVKGPELVNMYVGESERQVRTVFEKARRARPCVVFFDELDSLAPARGKGSDSGGVMDRVVAQLLAEIDAAQGGDGDASAGDIFLIGATNRPDLLDAALMRPGRLDRLLYVGIAPEPASKQKVLEALTRRFALADNVDLAAAAVTCPPQFTGADMYALCSDAWMTAFRRHIAKEDGGPKQSAEGIVVEQADFIKAATTLQPSLSSAEIAKYEALRDQYAQ